MYSANAMTSHHDMRWQIAFPDAGTLGLLQNFTNFLDRKEFRDYAETDVIG
jgi:hypothetical protein